MCAEIKKMNEDYPSLMRVATCFYGPVHETLVYTFFQVYTQTTDMLTYAQEKDLTKFFTRFEIHFLERQKRPSHLTLFLLYKILRSCCSPALPPYEDSQWSSASPNPTVPSLLHSLLEKFHHFLVHMANFTSESCVELMEQLQTASCSLTEIVSKISNNKRWKDTHDKIQDSFMAIRDMEYFSKIPNEDVASLELRMRNDRHSLLFKEELGHLNKESWHLTKLRRVVQSDNEELVNEMESVDVKLASIITSLIDGKEKQTTICGANGVGKSIFGLSLSFWRFHNEELDQLQYFDEVVHITAKDLPCEITPTGLLSTLVPLTTSLKDAQDLLQCLQSKKILLIIDDAEELSQDQVQRLVESSQSQTLYLVFLGQLVLEGRNIAGSLFYLAGMTIPKLLDLCHQWTLKGDVLSMKDLVKKNMNRFKIFLRHPSVLKQVCDIWNESQIFFSQVHTVSDVLWAVITWKAQSELNLDVSYPNDKTKRFYKLLRFAGELSTQVLRDKSALTKHVVDKLETEVLILFPVTGDKFLQSFLRPRIVQRQLISYEGMSMGGTPFLEFLSGWFVIKGLLEKKSWNEISPDPVSTQSIVYAGGHINRLQQQGNLTIAEEKRLIKPLVCFSEKSFEDFDFILNFVTELKCIKRLVELVVDNTEYNIEWNLRTDTLQLQPLKILLEHVSPSRLVFLVNDHTWENCEIGDILEYVRRVKLSVWLDSSTQFDYENSQKMDSLIESFMEGKVVPKIDLICGRLTMPMLEQIPRLGAASHLVLLKLRICDEKMLNYVLKVSGKLYKLLWLEIKLDFDIETISLCKIEKISVPLFDVHLRKVGMDQVGQAADLLMCMHSRFSGIHLEDTEFTPEGVFTFLKEVSKRNVSLQAEKEHINKFRRWYYPNINCIPRWKPLTEEQLIDLIGYDDIEFYSDHKVESSRFVTALDAWNLTSYLQSQENIIHFCYEASNIVFTKHLNGQVDSSYKGDYWQSIQESTRKISQAHKDLNVLESSPAFKDIYG